MSARFPQWRLRILSVFATIIVCVLFYRIIQIQIIRHDTYIELAKNQWHKKIKWHARRGSIYDRNGYPLAVSYRTYTIGITPRHFPADPEAAKYLAGIVGRKTSSVQRVLKMSKDSDYILLARDISLNGEQEARLSSLSGVKLDPEPERLNPLGSMTPRFVGDINAEGEGSGGVELAFEELLRGEDGWLLENRDALDKASRPINAPGKKPVDGCDVYLTIDSGIQAVVDFELDQAVVNYNAAAGVAIVIDPQSGDVVALSEKIDRERCSRMGGDYDMALYSTSCIFEPGSTFKLVTDAFLLEKGKVDPYDVFYGENGKAKFDFGTFEDDHEFEWLTFKESFVHSSNICTIKAIKDCNGHDFYSFMLRLGFGGRTGIDLPAESKGRLSEPAQWSRRSLASISIGQEVGVTAFQMAMAYCALANGGRLLVPRVVLQVRDDRNEVMKEFPTIEVRRVFSHETVKTMTEFCRSVVREGTGKNAAVDGLEVAGKTGTAQKSDGRRYLDGKYVASFIGFVPADDPRLVCLVLLDEPDYKYHYGGTSAAVVFSRIVAGINLSTDLFIGGAQSTYAVKGDIDKKARVPSFLRLNSSEAEELASESGLRLNYAKADGEVFSQVPGPGTMIETGGEVRLSFKRVGFEREKTVAVPDLKGLPVRKARRMLLECGLKSRIEGYGTVEGQKPEAGLMAKSGTLVTLMCVPNTGRKDGSERDGQDDEKDKKNEKDEKDKKTIVTAGADD